MPRNTNPVDGKAIREKREMLKLSAPQLAKLIGVTNGKIYKWEAGSTIPNTKADYNKITNWLNGTTVKVQKVIKPSNGVPSEDWKKKHDEVEKKYTTLLEKYTALLEKQNS